VLHALQNATPSHSAEHATRTGCARSVKQISDNEIYLLIKYIKKRSLEGSEMPVLYRGSAVPKG